MNPRQILNSKITEGQNLEQELAAECTRCYNTFSGEPMLVGNPLHCKLRTCNRRKHKAKMAELKRLEKGEKNE